MVIVQDGVVTCDAGDSDHRAETGRSYPLFWSDGRGQRSDWVVYNLGDDTVIVRHLDPTLSLRRPFCFVVVVIIARRGCGFLAGIRAQILHDRAFLLYKG